MSDKFKNLYESFVGHIDYCNFVESYGEDFIDFSDTNFALLQAQFCGFYLTLLLDEYLVKIDEENYTTKFIPEFIKEFVKMIAIDNGKGYTLGDLSYHDEVTALVKIRNKLAHGDFIILNNDIVFEENNVKGKINLDSLINTLAGFDESYENYFLTKPRCKVFNSHKLLGNFGTLNTEDNFDKLCNSLYRIEITDTPILGTTRNINYVNTINFLHEKIYDLIAKGKDDIIPGFISKNKKILDDNGIKVEYSYRKLPTTECYSYIKEKYMANFEQYKLLPITQQINIINNISYRMHKGKFQKFNLGKGIFFNLLILRELKKNHNITFREIIENNPSLYNMFLYHMDDVVISSYLVAFNSLYEYGLDKESTKNGFTNFIKIYDGEQLDFSQLSLEKLDDSNMTIERDCNSFMDDILKYETNSIDIIDKTILSKENNLKNYLERCKNKNEAKIKMLISEVEKAKQEKENLLLKIDEIKLAFANYDQEKYIRNLNIIYHIRNAISHGNLFVDSYSNNIQETSIVIKDFYEGKICYERKMKIKDFVTLFSIQNIKVTYGFIAENIVDETLPADDYLDKLNKRLSIRKCKYMKGV